MTSAASLDHLLKLRLVVARYGEMDRAGWWNTRVLGPQGKVVIERGFPRTQALARARLAFRVARARCSDVLTKPDAFSLWSLPAQLEDRFEERWFKWLEEDGWTAIIERLGEPEGSLTEQLQTLDLIGQNHIEALNKLGGPRTGEHMVAVSEKEEVDTDVLALLAAGFAKGEQGRLVVPYAMA